MEEQSKKIDNLEERIKVLEAGREELIKALEAGKQRITVLEAGHEALIKALEAEGGTGGFTEDEMVDKEEEEEMDESVTDLETPTDME